MYQPKQGIVKGKSLKSTMHLSWNRFSMDDWIFAIPTGAGPSYTWVVPLRNKSGEPLKGCRNNPCKKICYKVPAYYWNRWADQHDAFHVLYHTKCTKISVDMWYTFVPIPAPVTTRILRFVYSRIPNQSFFSCILGGGNSHPKWCYIWIFKLATRWAPDPVKNGVK